jgi:hypothetical protein
MRGGNRFDAGLRGEIVEELFEFNLRSGFGRLHPGRVAADGKIEIGSDEMFGLEAAVFAKESGEGLDHQGSADEQEQGNGNFAGDERAAESGDAGAGRCGASGFVENGIDVWAGELPGRGEAKENAGESCDCESEGECAQVKLNFVEARDVGGADGEENLQEPPAKERAGQATSDGEKQTFQNKLAKDARAAGSEGGANGDFLAARDGAGEKEVSDVGAGNEHYTGDDGPEEKEGGFEARTDRILQQRDGSDACAEEHAGMNRGDVGLDRVHFGGSLVEGDAGFEAADDVQPMAVAFARDAVPTGRQPKISLLWKFETARHDADDRVIAPAVSIDGDCLAKDVAAAAETALP